MALRQSDIQIHNNPNLAVVDSDFVKGGFRTAVGSVNDLYALSGKTDEPSAAGQVKEYATIVYVTGDSKYYVLKDVSNIANANGWEEFVAGGAGTITGATNGLSVSGMDIVLGGELTGETTICTNDNNLTIYNNLEPNNACIQLTKSGASMGSSINYISVCECPNNQNAAISVGDFITHSTISVHPDYINIRSEEDTSGCSTNMRVCWSGMTISSDVNNFAGVEYAADYSSNYSSLSLITYNDLIAATSGITGTLTGATNGLSVSGMDVVLGGTLLSGTTISLNGNNLAFTGATGAICSFVGTPTSYSCSSISSSCVSLEKVSTTNYAYIDIVGTSITTCAKGGNLDYSTNGSMIITAPSGATYAGCYHSNYTDRTLVDKEYVDNSKSHVCVVVTDADPYYIIGLDIVYVGVSGVTDDRVYLPSGTSLCVGRKITIADVCGEALTHRIIIDGAGKCINNNGCAVINTDYGSITLLYNGYFWSPISFVN